jgi:hypothetical protein
MSMDETAQKLWPEAYERLSADQPGLLGAITARAEAQTLRLAMIYALLDSTGAISKAHIQAALAVWEYCEASAVRIFGSLLGDGVADEILSALQKVGSKGLSRTEIRDLFGRNRSSERIGAALALLLTRGCAKAEAWSYRVIHFPMPWPSWRPDARTTYNLSVGSSASPTGDSFLPHGATGRLRLVGPQVSYLACIKCRRSRRPPINVCRAMTPPA